LSRYLDIIRPYRPDERGRQPGRDGLPAESSPEKVGAAPHANAGCEDPEEQWSPRVEDVLAEIGRSGSGPAKALGTYFEKPNAERLCWLTKAVLRALSMETDGWERYVPVVEEAAAKLGEDAGDRKDA
jgi:hypothetical protein